MVPVKIKLDDGAILPKYQHMGDAGMDVHCIEDFRLLPNYVKKVRTGIYVQLPDGYELQVRPRSGLASKGITVVNSPGTIDASYRGEICVLLRSPYGIDIEKGTRVAQLVLQKVPKIEWVLTNELGETKRGAGGFGSSGER